MSSPLKNIAWSGVGLGILVWFMSLAYGFQYLFSGSQHTVYFRIATVPFTAVVLFLTWQAVARVSSERLEFTAPWWLGLVMMSVSFALACFFYSSQLAPLPWTLIAVTLPVVAYANHLRWGYRGANAAFLIGAILLFIYLAARVPHTAEGDMLQIIEFAAKDLLAGENPYQSYLTSSGKEVPFGYWPGNFLPYVPLVALGLDMRILNLICLGLMILLFLHAAKHNPETSNILSISLYPFILSSPIWQMVLHGHLWLFWLLICATFVFLVDGRLVWVGLAFGLCLVSRPTTLFLAGPVAVYIWQRHGSAWLLKTAGISIAVVVLINFPFWLIYGDNFRINSYGRLVGFSQQLTHFSLSGYLQGAGVLWLAKPIQVIITLAAMVLILMKKAMTKSDFVFTSGILFVWLIMFNTYATRYVYFEGFFLIALSLVLASTGGQLPPSRGRLEANL